MTFTDFEYDGILLSDLECIVCSFGGDNDSFSSNGELSFNLVKTQRGNRFELISSEYDDSLEFSFQICKDFSRNVDMYFNREEIEQITSWLSRKSFYKFKILEEDYENLYFEASSNVKRKEIGGRVCGFDITMKTNTPHALHEPITLYNDLLKNQQWRYESLSNEEGNLYPEMTIKVKQNGDLIIYNEYDQSEMMIKNCVANEIITVNYPMIFSSLKSHKILNDFNWTFYPICNSFNNHTNTLSSSLPCEITMTYIPMAKIGY